MSQTGVDIIVPNVGTEHHDTAARVKYRSDREKEISSAVYLFKLCQLDFLMDRFYEC